MANVYAVKSGNWSDTTVWNTGALPTSSDDVYSNNFTVTIDQNVTVISLRNNAQSPAVAGGGFVLNGGYTITTTASVGFAGGSSTSNLITFSASGTSNLVGVVGMNANSTTFSTIVHSGGGTLNITGNLVGNNVTSGGSNRVITFNGDGIINLLGDIQYSYIHDSPMMSLTGTGTFNQTGNIYAVAVGGNSGRAFDMSNGFYNITGNITGTLRTTEYAIKLTSLAKMYVTGNVTHSLGFGTIYNTAYLNIVGTITASESISNRACAIFSDSYSAINIFSGPFVSSTNGYLPIVVFRMHLIISATSYYEYRNSSTDGVLPPSTPAPAARLVSPASAVDAPAASNVRFGVNYALGTQTGTLRVPSPNSVAFGVLTDNTTGTAVLTPQAVWDYATSSLTTAGSIGERLKNASTVDTTGDQLAALL
jgi:hypothetical protein